jgi:serine phosphatase RsbU (regulator of sigma subunit)
MATMNCREKANVLLVDDQPNNLLALEATLEGLGQNLVKARSGPEALKWLLNHQFAVILLDVLMPGMDGFETAELIRQREKTQRTPIIFLTAIGQNDVHMFKGYSVGAVDYLSKPVMPEILKSKVRVFVELFEKTEEIKRQAGQLREIERQEHERKLAEARQRWEAERLRLEIGLARKIQQKLFPASAPACPGFDIYGMSRPAAATGGDYFDYIPMLDGNIGIVIGDVTGHGLGPALLMSATRAYLRALALTYPEVAEILSRANTALATDIGDDRFVTLMLARLDPRSRSFSYCNAGHPSAYILDSAGAVKSTLASTSLPLGIYPNGQFPAEREIVLDPGDLVLLLTDGIMEAIAPAGSLFGIERTLEVVRANRHRTAQEIVQALAREVDDFTQFQRQLDDITAIVIKVGP